MNLMADLTLANDSHISRDYAVELHGLERRFGDNLVLQNLDLAIRPGEFVVLLGRSGSGKSTLLRTLAGLDTAPAGVLKVPASRAVVFQEPRLLPWKRVWQNVVLGLRAPTRQAAEAALREVEMAHRMDAWPLTLSGGEAQRAALARALVREPALLLLDEPFAALDALTRLRMQALVTTLWQAHGPAVLMVTHDVEEALILGDRVLVLENGRIAVDLDLSYLPRRRRDDPALPGLKRQLLEALHVPLD